MAVIVGTPGNDTLVGTIGSDTISGLAGDDRLLGSIGNDVLNGGVGNDRLFGEVGDDTYIVDNSGDRVFESLNQGNKDTVEASVSFVLRANLERLVLTGLNAINGRGNADNNTILGNAAANTIAGGNGNDLLFGGLGNDILNGGDGANKLRGGLGDDTYVISSLGTNSIVDTGGIDTVRAGISFVLGANIENLTLQGVGSSSGDGDSLVGLGGPTNGTGNALDNVIIGSALVNILIGGSGNDTLEGGRSNDTLDGGFGNDTLDGGMGADRLDGGFGNDTYFVDNAGDQSLDSGTDAGEIDTIQSSINLTLAINVEAQPFILGIENLTLVGSAMSGSGDSGSNTITGNDLANALNGGAGDDTLVGRAGNDALVGGAGNDTLFGDFGADSYIFSSTALFNLSNLGVDVINNFTSGSDKIHLDTDTFGAITAANVAIVANDAQAAISAGLITYSSVTGNLFFNQNGISAGLGTGGQFASITGALPLAIADFAISALA